MINITDIPLSFQLYLRSHQLEDLILIGTRRNITLGDIEDIVTDYHIGCRNKVRSILKRFDDVDIDMINNALSDYRLRGGRYRVYISPTRERIALRRI